MLPPECPDRIHVAFDDHRLVANAGLLLPVTLAHHLGLGGLVDRHVDLGRAPGRANVGDKVLTLVSSALAGGDCLVDLVRPRLKQVRAGCLHLPRPHLTNRRQPTQLLFSGSRPT